MIDPAVLVQRLPASVLAVFYTADSDEAARQRSREIHARFLHDFRDHVWFASRGGALSAERFPLLEYHASKWETARFTCVDCG